MIFNHTLIHQTLGDALNYRIWGPSHRVVIFAVVSAGGYYRRLLIFGEIENLTIRWGYSIFALDPLNSFHRLIPSTDYSKVGIAVLVPLQCGSTSHF
jgi:hypothetical protein